MAVEVKTIPNPDMTKVSLMATFDQNQMLSSEMVRFLFEEVAALVAQRYVEEHYAELVANLDQQAISNLAIADAGKKIAEEIRSQPRVVHDKETKTEVYQRGLLGGMRRIR